MTASKRKGSAFETAVVGYLADHGWPNAERRVQGGTRDRGDVAGVPGWTLELKATRTLDLAGAMTEAQLEADHAGTANYAAILKRRSHTIADSYVVVPLSTFAGMLSAKEDLA